MNKLIKAKRFVIIGGGTGTFSILSGLKKYTDKITAIVTMADSGGSAKKERDEWGLLPSSDIRKSLIALADVSRRDNLLLRRLFQYRYSEGTGITGMTFGNLFLVALTKLLGSQSRAIKKAGQILRIRGKVLPVTLDKVDLVAYYEDNSKVVGEHFIDQPEHNGKLAIAKLATKPKAIINPEVKEAISQADVIIIGPGSFYTTIVANLVVAGVSGAIQESQAIKIFILNLMTEYGQTYSFTSSKFIAELDKYLPSKTLDYILINNAPIPSKILNKYKKVSAEPVVDDFTNTLSAKVVPVDLLSAKMVRREKGDTLMRSFIRHDPDKIASQCIKLASLV